MIINNVKYTSKYDVLLWIIENRNETKIKIYKLNYNWLLWKIGIKTYLRQIHIFANVIVWVINIYKLYNNWLLW